MVAMSSAISRNEKEALIIMFGQVWKKKFWPLDGQKGRPCLNDCIDFALKRLKAKSKEDLVDYVESYLRDMARRCEASARSDRSI
ncbi:MAG TPA: hypothetical protein VEL47_03285 [Myxococcota bacterium]|nr:hypothetical protein [Myxococcota bacterium]